MNFLFFDIECVSVGETLYPFSFGYVLTDSKLAVIKQQDILINPEVSFRLDGNGVRIYYSRHEIESAGNFASHYETIRSLLSDPNSLVIGHAIENDIHFLHDAMTRYSLPPLHFFFYDSQWMYASLLSRDEPTSLEKIINENRLIMLNAHNSMADAYYTMMTCKTLQHLQGIELSELLSSKFYPGLVDNYDFRPMACPTWFLPSVKLQRIKHSLFSYLSASVKPARRGPFLGLKFSFNTVFAYHDLTRSYQLLLAIAELGGEYTDDCYESDYFLHAYNDCLIQEQLSDYKDWQGEFVSYSRLLQMVNKTPGDMTDSQKINAIFAAKNLV